MLGVGGGLGAGYILWEFEAHGSPTLVLGYRNRWQYPARWMRATLERLGVPASHHETGGARAAAAQLDAALTAGRPALATIDRQSIGYWHLPAKMEGRGGYPVVVYGEAGGRMRVDDRGLAPLTVAREVLDAARARVGSYKHRLCVIEPDREVLGADELRAAVRAGWRTPPSISPPRAHSSRGYGAAQVVAGDRYAYREACPRASPKAGYAGARTDYEGLEPPGLDGATCAASTPTSSRGRGVLEGPAAGAAVAWRAAGGHARAG